MKKLKTSEEIKETEEEINTETDKDIKEETKLRIEIEETKQVGNSCNSVCTSKCQSGALWR